MITLHTNKGDIKINLFTDKAPVTCQNFIDYAKSKHYDGTIFHRVIKGFMIQGGGLNSRLEPKETRDPIKNEANNGLSNKRYTIAMARTSDPHSATCQFFINTRDNLFLDFKSETRDGWGYCVFGEVVEGQNVVDEIEKAPQTRYGMYDDVPREAIVIESADVE